MIFVTLHTSMNIKQQFPDESALRDYVSAHAAALFQTFKESFGAAEAEYLDSLARVRQARVSTVLGLVFLVVTYFIFRFTLDTNTGFTVGRLALIAGCIILGIYFLRYGSRVSKGAYAFIHNFNQAVNTHIFPVVFSIFSIEATRLRPTLAKKVTTSSTPTLPSEVEISSDVLALFKHSRNGLAALTEGYQKIISLLDQSGLITEPKNSILVDDIVAATVRGQSLLVSELNVSHVTGSGKNRRVKNIFKGYFVSYEIPAKLTGSTFISTEGDTDGFGNQSFLDTFRDSAVRPTSLEWNEFEDLLHVVTSDPVEARYILTPDFMVDVFDWWQHKKTNIRISFKENRMSVLYPDANIKMFNTLKTLTEDEFTQYVLSIAIPLLYVVHLIEDVNRRFR